MWRNQRNSIGQEQAQRHALLPYRVLRHDLRRPGHPPLRGENRLLEDQGRLRREQGAGSAGDEEGRRTRSARWLGSWHAATSHDAWNATAWNGTASLDGASSWTSDGSSTPRASTEDGDATHAAPHAAPHATGRWSARRPSCWPPSGCASVQRVVATSRRACQGCTSERNTGRCSAKWRWQSKPGRRAPAGPIGAEA